ncbi:MAG: hypothetical protein BGO39_21985 [Chloroflexi bacterium 54-19]|nr:MAG: hypothetical protein BGO39_21985 [Chloroflexi bacterium 54-19]
MKQLAELVLTFVAVGIAVLVVLPNFPGSLPILNLILAVVGFVILLVTLPGNLRRWANYSRSQILIFYAIPVLMFGGIIAKDGFSLGPVPMQVASFISVVLFIIGRRLEHKRVS